MTRLLVQNGANVNLLVPGVAGTPLQSACLGFIDDDSTNIIRFLLDHGADESVRGGYFGSIINAAAFQASAEVVTLLLSKGSSVHAGDDLGRLPVHFSAFHSMKNLQVMLYTGGNVHARDKLGRTALHWAAQSGHFEMVGYLLTLLPEDSVNDPDIDGWTPLCWAARGTRKLFGKAPGEDEVDQLKVLEVLLKHGADRCVRLSIEDQDFSPLKLATYTGADSDVLELLEKDLESASNALPDTGMSKPINFDKNLRWKKEGLNHCDGCFWVSANPWAGPNSSPHHSIPTNHIRNP